MNVNFYQFQKRENSTAQPGVGVTATTYVCKLKDNCSIINPVIQIAKESAQAWSLLIGFNYAYIPDFNRYYFVRDIVMESNVICSITLEVDALASWKSQIGTASEYVLRSASSYDGDIEDNYYPIKALTQVTETGQDVMFRTSGGGTPLSYVIGIVNNSSSHKFGATEYYVVDSTQLANIMGFLLGNNIFTESEAVMNDIQSTISTYVTEIQNGLIRALSNPTQYIVESYAVPYTIPTAAAETIQIGWWPTALTASPVLSISEIQIASGILNLGDHPQKASRGGYLNTEPFTRYYVDFGLFGQVPIDTMRILGATSIVYSIFGDPFGNVYLEYGTSAGAHLGRLNANVKCNFPIGQVSIDALGGAQAMLSAITPMTSGSMDEAVADTISGASGVISAARAMLPDVRTSGSAGTLLGAYKNARLYTECHYVVDDDIAQRGRPLCKKVQISTLSGFILVSDPDIAITGTAEENDKIKSYMASGFFYE